MFFLCEYTAFRNITLHILYINTLYVDVYQCLFQLSISLLSTSNMLYLISAQETCMLYDNVSSFLSLAAVIH